MHAGASPNEKWMIVTPFCSLLIVCLIMVVRDHRRDRYIQDMKNANTKVIGGTIIGLVLIGTYYNSQQITRLKPMVISHDLPSPTGRKQRRSENAERKSSTILQQKASCLKARKETIPKSMYGKLSRPFINLGLPKMGEIIAFCTMRAKFEI